MQTTTPVTRVDLDPRDLLIDVNIRTDARLDKDFVASIKDFGVLVPITAVRTTGGEVRVRFGHRRTLAAIEADLVTIPVEIVGDEATDDAGQIERILTQHAENAHRTPLLQNEQVGVVEQRSAFGLSAAQIAKRTKIKRDTVNTALAVAKSDLAKAASDRYDFLTLEQAAAVAEFDDDADAVKELIVQAQNGYGFNHCLQRLRDERAYQAMTQTIVEQLDQLGTDDDLLTPEEHASCGGHVAWIEERWVRPDDAADDDDVDEKDALTYIAVYGCSDPVAYGHVEPRSTAARDSRNGTQVSDEEAKAERQRVLRNNKAWRAAETVRREWLKAFVSRKSAPKGAQRFIFGELAVGGYQLCDAMQKHHRFGCELLGVIDVGTLTDTLKNASEARAQMITLALVLGAHEADLGVHTWRNRNHAAKRYLSEISAWGYELSEIEQSVIKDDSDDQ
jgi:ParB family chromosome partitioning protein